MLFLLSSGWSTRMNYTRWSALVWAAWMHHMEVAAHAACGFVFYYTWKSSWRTNHIQSKSPVIPGQIVGGWPVMLCQDGNMITWWMTWPYVFFGCLAQVLSLGKLSLANHSPTGTPKNMLRGFWSPKSLVVDGTVSETVPPSPLITEPIRWWISRWRSASAAAPQ